MEEISTKLALEVFPDGLPETLTILCAHMSTILAPVYFSCQDCTTRYHVVSFAHKHGHVFYMHASRHVGKIEIGINVEI